MTRARRWRPGFAAVAITVAAIVGLSGCSSTDLRPPEVNLSPAQEAEQASIDLQRYADAVLSRYPDAELPTVERVRFILTNEWGATIADCLKKAGFEAETALDGGLGTESIPAQDEPFLIAMYVCNAQYPQDPRQTVPLVDDQIRYLYEYYVTVATPCLEGMGFEVLEPPSRQTYIDSYRDGPSWHPYEDAGLRSTTKEWARIQSDCPEVPEGFYGM